MNEQEIIDIVRSVMPGVSVCVVKQTWHHAHLGGDSGLVDSYQLTILPGLHGEKCSLYPGDSIQECAEKWQEDVEHTMASAARRPQPQDFGLDADGVRELIS